jgi:hypothetical protein
MLGTNDRLIINRGTCSFHAPNGSKISVNEMLSWSRPMAQVNIALLRLLSDYLKNVLECTVEAEQKDDGRFILIFRTQPKLARHDDPMPFIVMLASANEKLTAAGSPALESATRLLNSDGAGMIGWILKAVHGKDLTYVASDTELSWKPPPKKEGYAPLGPPAVAPTAVQRLAAAVRPSRK